MDLDTGVTTLQAIRTVQEGYDRVEFRGPAEGRRDLYEQIVAATVNELALYYYLVSERNLIDTNFRWIDIQLNALIALQEARGVKARFRRLWRGGRDALSLNLQLLEAESWAAELDATIDSLQQDLYAVHPFIVFKPWIEKESYRARVERGSNLRDMVAALSARHSNSVQVVAVVASSIGGGVVGAALAALAAGIGGA